jgi:hypothetical protein
LKGIITLQLGSQQTNNSIALWRIHYILWEYFSFPSIYYLLVEWRTLKTKITRTSYLRMHSYLPYVILHYLSRTWHSASFPVCLNKYYYFDSFWTFELPSIKYEVLALVVSKFNGMVPAPS